MSPSYRAGKTNLSPSNTSLSSTDVDSPPSTSSAFRSASRSCLCLACSGVGVAKFRTNWPGSNVNELLAISAFPFQGVGFFKRLVPAPPTTSSEEEGRDEAVGTAGFEPATHRIARLLCQLSYVPE